MKRNYYDEILKLYDSYIIFVDTIEAIVELVFDGDVKLAENSIINAKPNRMMPGVKFANLNISSGRLNCWKMNNKKIGNAISKIILIGSLINSLKFLLAKFNILIIVHPQLQ